MMVITTTENIPGFRVDKVLGEVAGVVVRSRGIGGNITAGLRALGGGEIVEYTRMLEDTRRQAIDRMAANAQARGANAVIMMRFNSTVAGKTMSEIAAFGTAVTVRPEQTDDGA
jgi:uncharacterized protein YbjQ (UPF0145 family)